ncbi:MAG: Sau3AI family type II restriction endonuclease [Bacillota bacterium]
MIFIFEYDETSADSIEKHAKKIVNKSISDLYKNDKKLNKKNKGRLGQLVERIHFGIENNSDERPDFPFAGKRGVELKVTPVKEIKKRNNSKKAIKRNGLSVKERLVLKMIDYNKVVNESWEDNSLLDKIDLILLMFYLYKRNLNIKDYKFILASLWSIPEKDFDIIKSDWEKIINKIKNGDAHKLSEGDTLYLGACTKASSSDDRRNQPCSKIAAKPRAFSLKRSYMDEIFNRLYERKNKSKNQISLLEGKIHSLETELKKIFKPYLGYNTEKIEKELKIYSDKMSKNYLSRLVNKIMGNDERKEIEEFKKAGIEIKTLRVNKKLVPFESLSFPAFDYRNLKSESWINSEFHDRLENTKYFFVIFKSSYESKNSFNSLSNKEKKQDLHIIDVMLWNMPGDDIETAKFVWEKMNNIMNKGGPIIKKISKNGRRFTNFPNKSENPIAHVRPHARSKNDTSPLPSNFELEEYTKHSFWLNKEYIAKNIKKEIEKNE